MTIMFSNLKDKLSNVQDGIVTSLHRDEVCIQNSRREYLSGALLLAKYQQDWQGIHALSEQNARQAKVVDQQIEDINRHIICQWRTMRKLTNDVGVLNNIVTQAEKALNTIGNIRILTDKVQHEIIELEDLMGEERQGSAVSHAFEKLTAYRKEKLMSLDVLREKLARDHEARLKLIDEENEEMKRKNFQLAEKKFLEDLNAYKDRGILPKKCNTIHQLLSIEDVEIEQDFGSFQEYLDG